MSITADQLLGSRTYRDVEVVTVTPTSLSARVDGKLVEIDLEAKPDLNAEVQAIAPGASRLRIAQASLESVRADELNPGQAEAWLVVADPKPGLDADGTPRALFTPAMSLLSVMPRSVTRYAPGLTADEIAAWPTLSALISRAVGDGGQSSSRNGANVDALQAHHSTMLSADAYIALVQGLMRQVSSNLAVDNDGEIIRLVNLNRRAWTSGSASMDARAITVETANATLAPNYSLSEKAKAALGRIAAAIKVDRLIQKLTTANVYLHREMLPRWGVSYSTACPMDITAGEIIQRAESGALPVTPLIGENMYLLEEGGKVYLVNEHGVLWVDQTVVDAVVKVKTASPLPGKLTLKERAALELALHTLARRGPLIGDDDYGKIAGALKPVGS